MKKIYLLTKTLLVAALLMIGANVWADDKAVLDPTGTAQLSLEENTTSATSWKANQAGVRNSGDYIGTFTTNNVVVTKFDASSTLSGKTLIKAELKFHSVCTTSGKNSNLWAAVLNNVSWNVADVSNGNLNVKDFADYNKTALIGNANSSGADLTLDVTSWLNSDDDKVIGFGIYTATGREQQITNITLEVTYSSETLYTATFTENNSLTPAVTIYSDAERTSSVMNGTLADKTTYYYRAVLEGYNNYDGSFTIDGANPSENFTMTAKARYTFTVNLINSVGGAVIQTLYTDEDSYDGKKHNISFPAYMTGVGNVVTYVKDDATYYQSYTSASAEATKTVSYTAYTGEAYFFEGEDIEGATTYTTNTFRPRTSNGATGVLTAATVKSLEAGTYKITARSIGKNDNTHSIYKTSTEGEKILDIVTSTTGRIGSAIFTLDATTDIVANGGYYTTSDNGHGFDYILIEKNPTVSVTVTSAGYATYVNNDYDLDFSATTIEAYKVKVSAKGVATLTKVDNVPAGTPVLLYKEGGATEDIPVLAGAAAVTENDLVAGTGAAVATIDGDYTNMILNNVDDKVGFYYAAGQTVAANRAYLHIATTLAPEVAAARMMMVFADEVTGIKSTNVNANVNNVVYNLGGQRISKAVKGLYIVNGKKVVK